MYFSYCVCIKGSCFYFHPLYYAAVGIDTYYREHGKGCITEVYRLINCRQGDKKLGRAS